MSADPRLSIGPGLARTSTDQVAEALDRLRPVIRIEPGVGPPSATAIGGLFSLLVRVHPHTTIDGDAEMGLNPWGVTRLSEMADRLTASRPEPRTDPSGDLIIGAGASISSARLWVGGGDWTALVGPQAAPLDATVHGYGVHAAAVLAAAEIMKLVLGPHRMMHVPLTGQLTWNLINYQLTPAGTVEARPVCHPDIALLGAGSVGSSGGGLLICDTDTIGNVVVVDPDRFDPARNPYRYPASTGTENGHKADWVAGLLRDAGWSADSVPSTVAGWTRAQPQPGWAGTVISSVDRLDGRLDVADTLPRTALSIGVAGLALHAQLEHSYDDYACPFCDFAGEAPPMTAIQALANQVGLPPARVAQLDLDGLALERADVEGAVAAGRIRAERAEELIGRRIDDLVRRAYAEVTVPIPGAEPASVSAPYVSWMGGLFAAVEIAKAVRGLPTLDRRVDLDLSGIPLGVQSRRPRNKAGSCPCASPKRQAWAARMYGRDGPDQ
jgi:hypothetical protein